MSHIRIAVTNVASEISFDSNQSSKEIKSAVDAAIANGATLSLVDVKGREFLVPAANIGFIEIGEQAERRVGFGQ